MKEGKSMANRFHSILAGSILLTCALSTHADISYTQKIAVEAAGGMSMFASEGNVVTQISGDKARTDTSMKMKSKLASMMGSGDSSNIVRLDKALSWNLAPDKKQFTEMTFVEARAQFEQASEAMRSHQEQGGSGGALPVSADACQWSEADLEVEHPGEREKVAGIKTKKHIIRLRQSCTEPETKKICDITWVMETWLARKVPAEKEARKFQHDYAEAMGMDDLAQQIQGPAQGLLGMFSGNWDDVVEEFEKMKGYPLRSVMQMGIGGEQCTTDSGEPIGTDEVWADASTAAYNAALDQAGYQAGSAVGRAAGEAMGGSVGGSIGGAAVGAAAGELIGGLTGMFKKKKTAKPTPQPTASPGGRQVTVFRISSEITDWSEATVPSARFEIPAGWKKR
jgi:hypothetical protein